MARAFVLLDSLTVDWLLLRGGVQASAGHTGDVDLLVRARDLDRVKTGLEGAGWLAVPSSGHGPHNFFVRYDAASGKWHEFDVVANVSLGDHQEFRTDLADDCLNRAVRIDGVPRPHGDDMFWLLFLHTAWKSLTTPRQAALARAAASAGPSGPAAAVAARLLDSHAIGLEEVLVAARAGDWVALRAAQAHLRRQARRNDPVRSTATYVGNALLRRISVPRSLGVSVALVGLDGAGKTTVAHRLLTEIPWPSVSIYMGVWRESALDRLLQPVIGAQLLLRLGRLTRCGVVARYHRQRGRLVIMDRYVTDARLPSPDLDWKGRVSAVLVLRTAAAPDRYIFLDAAPHVVFERKGELTLDELTARRGSYRQLASRLPNFLTIDAEQPLEKVLRDVSEVLWDDLRRAALHAG